jgi:repressor of nif and glnA expression
LKTLEKVSHPLGAARIADALRGMGIDLQPRTIRFHLLQMEASGLTRLVTRRRGRILTDRGREELAGAAVMDKVGFVAAKVDTLGYQMTFEHSRAQGTVILNVSFIERHLRRRALTEMKYVFDQGLGMGNKLILAHAGERVCGITVPDDVIAVGTVCSVTVNGILLHEGIPVTSRYGGLLEMRDGRPVRFVELVQYSGTSLDPLEIFIKAGMTRVRNAARTGTGLIGASFREVPSVAVEDIRRISSGMAKHGLGGILTLGRPNQPLFDIPVSEGRTGMIVVGGLNPIAAVHEAGIEVSSRSLAGLEDFSRLVSIDAARQKV